MFQPSKLILETIIVCKFCVIIQVNLKGHDGKVSSLNWSKDDQRIVSCAEDGSLYEWDVSVGRRVHESVIKTCSYNDITLSPEDSIALQDTDTSGAVSGTGKKSCVIYAVGSDKTVKQIQESNLLKEVDLHTLTLSSLVLSNDGCMLFSGTIEFNSKQQ